MVKDLSFIMADFDKHKGGTEVDPEYTTKDPEALKTGLQESFDKIFPELVKKSKHRKYVIFDHDVFQFFCEVSEDTSANFSSLINSALRYYVREKFANNSTKRDPVAELLAIRERERELLKKVKELDLVEELNKKIG